MSHLTHQLARLRAAVHATRGGEPDVWAYVLLHKLITIGPMRAGALAELGSLDQSTLSRQVAVLVKEGLIERRADPQDGRATVLAATAAGESLHERMIDRRTHVFGEWMADWSAEDRACLAGLLHRLVADLETYKPTLIARFADAPAFLPASGTDPVSATATAVDHIQNQRSST